MKGNDILSKFVEEIKTKWKPEIARMDGGRVKKVRKSCEYNWDFSGVKLPYWKTDL